MPMHDNTGRVWPATSNSAWPEESRLLSATSAPFTPHSQFQRSAVLSWSQFNDWAEISDGRVASLATEDSAAAHSHNAVRASVTPDAQSFAGTSKAPGVQPDEAILDFLDMDLLEELSKGSLSTNTTTELKIPDPIIAFRRDPPLLIAPSLPPHMPAADQERAKACWDSMRSISDPAGGFSPALVTPPSLFFIFVIRFSCREARCVCRQAAVNGRHIFHPLMNSPDPSKTQSGMGTVLSICAAPCQPGRHYLVQLNYCNAMSLPGRHPIEHHITTLHACLPYCVSGLSFTRGPLIVCCE